MFSIPESSDTVILHGEHSVILVIISVIIACGAAYTALSMNQRIKHSSFFHKNFWLILSSFAMGLGIWSMHFIGMSAFMLPISMKYDVFLTIISIVPAVFASYLAFYFANSPKKTQRSFLIAGIIMGLGISSMHYIGMAAMKMDASYIYKPWLFAGSIVIAIIASHISLYTFSALQKFMSNQFVKIITSVLLGLAISSMHYTGMYAVVFYTEKSLVSGLNLDQMHHMDTSLLIIIVSVGISLLFLISGLTSLLDRYVDDRLHHFDPLTLFPNQRQFEQDLDDAKTPGTLAILHIHNFEEWVTNQGYTFGDNITKTAGSIIQRLVPAYAKVYRIEGNRFAIFQLGKSEQDNMIESLEKIIAVLEEPVLVDHQHVLIDVLCSISYTNEKKEIRELFSNCMAVMNHPVPKTNKVIVYDSATHTYTFERQIIQDINRAIIDAELFLVYQPKVSSKSFELSGLETLLRWNHPIYGMISPGVFIPILEESGEIRIVTDWIIKEVCKQISDWLKKGVHFHQVSINIPGSYVTSQKLLDVIEDNLSTYNIDSSYLELEITETSVIHHIEYAITTVNKFKELGLAVTLDDFGTGLSSLAYLKRLPISTIKIDKSFVDDVPTSDKDSAILDAIITLCYSLNLQVVIEGVESKEQMDFILSTKETPQIQGYYFSRPLTAEEIEQWIKREDALRQHGS